MPPTPQKKKKCLVVKTRRGTRIDAEITTGVLSIFSLPRRDFFFFLSFLFVMTSAALATARNPFNRLGAFLVSLLFYLLSSFLAFCLPSFLFLFQSPDSLCSLYCQIVFSAC